MLKTKGDILKVKRRAFLVGVIAVLLLSIIAIIFLSTGTTALATGIENSDSYNFTIVTSSEGEQSYSVAIKTSAKPTVETVIIPETYNGLPVTEIANNGFVSCANLKKVVLPTTLKKIGNNAFMNCAKLERISLPNVESIGMNAFAMCSNLDRTFIPNTVNLLGQISFAIIQIRFTCKKVQTKSIPNGNQLGIVILLAR